MNVVCNLTVIIIFLFISFLSLPSIKLIHKKREKGCNLAAISTSASVEIPELGFLSECRQQCGSVWKQPNFNSFEKRRLRSNLWMRRRLIDFIKDWFRLRLISSNLFKLAGNQSAESQPAFILSNLYSSNWKRYRVFSFG